MDPDGRRESGGNEEGGELRETEVDVPKVGEGVRREGTEGARHGGEIDGAGGEQGHVEEAESGEEDPASGGGEG